jgi:hypothetical protein
MVDWKEWKQKLLTSEEWLNLTDDERDNSPWPPPDWIDRQKYLRDLLALRPSVDILLRIDKELQVVEEVYCAGLYPEQQVAYLETYWAQLLEIKQLREHNARIARRMLKERGITV